MRAYCPKCKGSVEVVKAFGYSYSNQAPLAVEMQGQFECGHPARFITSKQQYEAYERMGRAA